VSVLFLDPFSGVSGDMMLGLLIDLGVPAEAIETELRRLLWFARGGYGSNRIAEAAARDLP
jgi:uncharacterized protein (DUF111 family)